MFAGGRQPEDRWRRRAETAAHGEEIRVGTDSRQRFSGVADAAIVIEAVMSEYADHLRLLRRSRPAGGRRTAAMVVDTAVSLSGRSSAGGGRTKRGADRPAHRKPGDDGECN